MIWRMKSTHFSGMGDASYPNMGLSLCQLLVKVTQTTHAANLQKKPRMKASGRCHA